MTEVTLQSFAQAAELAIENNRNHAYIKLNEDGSPRPGNRASPLGRFFTQVKSFFHRDEGTKQRNREAYDAFRQALGTSSQLLGNNDGSERLSALKVNTIIIAVKEAAKDFVDGAFEGLDAIRKIQKTPAILPSWNLHLTNRKTKENQDFLTATESLLSDTTDTTAFGKNFKEIYETYIQPPETKELLDFSVGQTQINIDLSTPAAETCKDAYTELIEEPGNDTQARYPAVFTQNRIGLVTTALNSLRDLVAKDLAGSSLPSFRAFLIEEFGLSEQGKIVTPGISPKS